MSFSVAFFEFSIRVFSSFVFEFFSSRGSSFLEFSAAAHGRRTVQSDRVPMRPVSRQDGFPGLPCQ